MKNKLVILLLTGYFFSVTASAQVCNTSGIFSIGPSGTYPTLSAAANALRSDGLAGSVVLELQSSYNSSGETFPIDFSGINCLDVTRTITIRPAVGATGLSISTGDQYTINLHDTRFLNIDGRPGGAGTAIGLSIINTNDQGAAVRFINGASRNQLTYLNILGSASTGVIGAVTTYDTTGVINFSASATGAGCDSNTISFCNISKAGSTTPGTLIHALGASGKINDRNAINNCNLYDFYQQDKNSYGILLEEYNSKWSISNNNVYQTSTRNYIVTTYTPDVYGIKIASTFSGGFFVSGNYVGGNQPLAGGSATTMTGNFVYNGIAVGSSNNTTTPDSVINNVVANISLSPTNNIAMCSGIQLGVPSTSYYGVCSNNTIGSMTSTGSISYSPSGSSSTFIGIGGTIPSPPSQPVTINLNKIGGISLSGASPAFWGINTGGTANVIIDNNTIGAGTAVVNSILNTSAGVNYGIRIVNYSYSGNLIIKNNTIQNLNSTYTFSGANVTGIYSEGNQSGRYLITNNIITRLSAFTSNTSSTASAVSGIALTVGGTPAISVNNNIINHLFTNSTSPNYINGIYYKGPVAGADSINGNIISAFSSLSSANQTYRGIHLEDGTSLLYNNVVRLGLDANGNSLLYNYNIYGISENAGQNSLLHNSVYIGGNNVPAATANTYGFYTTVTTGTRVVANNIFFNARSTTSGAGKNYCVNIAGTTGLYQDYNIYYTTGTNGHIGKFNNTDYDAMATWSAATLADNNSNFINPQFANITGPITSMDYHLAAVNPAEGSGTGAYTVLEDIDAETRSSLTPVDIGADAGLYSNTPIVDLVPPVINYTVLANAANTNNVILTATISDVTTGVDTTGNRDPRIWYRRNTPTQSAWVSTAGVFVSGNILSGTYDFTIDYSLIPGGIQWGDNIQYYVVAQDKAVPFNIASEPLAQHTSVNVQVAAPAIPNAYSILDDVAPLITYTPPGNAVNTNNVSLSADISDAGAGVDITGINAPRIWYRRNTPTQSAWVSTAGVLTAGTINAGTYNFTIDYSLIPGGITWGDNIQYYVVAQDASIPVNVGSEPLAQHTSVNVQVSAPVTPNAYTVADNVAPVITYTSLSNQSNTNNVTLTATISDAAAGVDITGGNDPQIWYRRNTPNQSAWVHNPGVLTSGTINSGTYDFTIDYSLIPGAVQWGDNIQYYVVAQDMSVPFNIGSVPPAQHTSVNVQVAAPVTPNAYSVIPQISGDIFVGSGQVYTSLTNAGGVFAAINTYGIAGNLTVNVTSDLIETGANYLEETGLQGHTLRIVPATNGVKRIYNNVNISDPLIYFDNTSSPIVIDGSFNGAGRNLQFSYASTLTANSFVQNALFITGDNLTIKNSVFESTCIYPSGGTVHLVGANHNIVIDNNIFKDVESHPVAVGQPKIALFVNGGSNISVTNNEIYNASQLLLDFRSGVDTCYVTGNHFYNTIPFTGTDMMKIYGGREYHITDNFFGGSAPNCGGTPFMATGGMNVMNFVNNPSLGIDMTMSVQNNVIKNIRLDFVSTQAIAQVGFYGIIFDNIADINIGNLVGNKIGDINDASSIDIEMQSNSELEVAGIRYKGSKNVNISNNIIGGFTVNADLNYSFQGGGIISPAESTVAGTVPTNVITENNTIKNINCTIHSPVSWSWLYAINSGNLEANGIVDIKSNNISGIKASFDNPGCAVAGIAVTQKNPGSTTIVENNRISGLVQQTAYGELSGIKIGSNTIDTKLYNNEVSVTNENFDNPLHCYGIYSDGNNNLWSSQQQSFLYNSVYVGGHSSVIDTSVAFSIAARSFGSNTGIHVNTFRNNLLYNDRNSASGKHYAISVNTDPARPDDWSASTSDYNLMVVGDTLATARWQDGSLLRLSEFKQINGGDSNTYFTLTSNVPSADLFIHKDTANLNINASNDLCWYVNGKGTPIDTLGTDFGNDPRSISINDGATDIGADEFNTSTVPPTVDIYGRHMPGGSDTLVWAGRTIGLINWGNNGLLPTFGPIRWFTGTWPNDTTNNGTINGARFMNHYIQVATTGGNDYSYDFTMNYIPSLLGRITDESTMLLNKREINVNGSWTKIIPTIANPVNRTLKVSGLSSFSEFTGTDGNAALSNTQWENPVHPPVTGNQPDDIFHLSQNPCNGILTVSSNLTGSKNITLIVIDASGKTIEKYNIVASGQFSHSFDLRKYSNGVYFLRSQVDNDKKVTRFVLLR